jgi:hypothetical protein
MLRNIKINHATSSWLLLIILTIVSIFLPDLIESRYIYISTALLIVVVKGQQVVDVFMELGQAPTFWRLLFLSYIVVVPLIITAIYLMS